MKPNTVDTDNIKSVAKLDALLVFSIWSVLKNLHATIR
jgi:hypothetical protein